MQDNLHAPSPPRLGLECLIASAGIVLIFAVVKHVARGWGELEGTLLVGVQLFVPLALLGRRNITNSELGLSSMRWAKDVAVGIVAIAIVGAPFAVAHHYWQTMIMGRPFHPRMPDGIAMACLTQVLAVAFPEELFFRGYLQRRLEHLWPAQRRIIGVPFGAAIVVSSTIFALVHFAGEYRLDRLAPFFPGLVFGFLRTKTSSIVAPVVFHALSNVWSEALFASYR